MEENKIPNDGMEPDEKTQSDKEPNEMNRENIPSDTIASDETRNDRLPDPRQPRNLLYPILVGILSVLVIVLSVLVIRQAMDKNRQTPSDTTTASPSETTAGTADTTPADTFEIQYIDPSQPLEENLTALGLYDSYDYDLSAMMTLGDYLHIVIDVSVTQDMIDDTVQAELQAAADTVEVTDRPIAEGDTVDIAFTGYVDGVEDPNCTGTKSDLVIGSKAFIDGFESGLVGYKTGDQVTLELTFPDDYYSTDYAGKPVRFEVTVNGVYETIIPELDDAFVQATTDYDTVEAYLAALKVKLHEENYTQTKKNWTDSVWAKLLQDVQVTVYPAKEYRANYDYYCDYYVEYASAYGFGLESFITSMLGMTMDDFYQTADEYAIAYLKEEMAMFYIIRAEGISLTEEEYQTELAALAEQYNVSSPEAFEEMYTREMIEANMLYEKTLNFIADNASMTGVPENAAELDAKLAETESM